MERLKIVFRRLDRLDNRFMLKIWIMIMIIWG